jgi:transcription antitermination protein NusB
VISRRKGREFAMQSLYAAEVGGTSFGQDGFGQDGPGRDSLSNNELLHDEPVAADTREYGLRLARAAHGHAEEIDRLITECSERWDLARLAVVDRVILRMSIAELMTQPDVPAKVCINEAVEIARKFSTENSSRFVNGVLDAVSRKLRQPPGEAPESNPGI